MGWRERGSMLQDVLVATAETIGDQLIGARR
jgi:hypothetical protein